MSEYSGKKSRGRMVGLVFAMQGAGLVVGPLIAAILLAANVPQNLIWRILLGLGAVPGLAVFYLRRQINETPRFAQAGGDLEELQASIAAATGQAASSGPRPESKARNQQSALEGFKTLARNHRMLFWLIGTAGAWAMLDFAYYGNTISSPEVLKVINPHGSLLYNTLLQLLIFVVFALPGYALAIKLIDRTGRKKIQCLGFSMMALAFLLIGLVPGVTTTVAPFVLLFGMSYFFTEFGPNMTTFVYPAEIFPVDVRTTGHGISAAAGKMGAFAGAYLFPSMLASSWGLRGAEVVAGIVCLVGLGLTAWLLPEPKGLTLEQLEEGRLRGPGPRHTSAGDVMTHTIVVGVDGSDHGNAALHWAVKEAQVHQSGIVTVFAWQLPFIGIPGAFDREEVERLCKAFLEETVAAVVPGAGVPITQTGRAGRRQRLVDRGFQGSRHARAGVPGAGRLRRPQAGLGQPGVRPARRLPRRDHQTARGRLRRRCSPPAAPAPQPLDWGPTGTKRGDLWRKTIPTTLRRKSISTTVWPTRPASASASARASGCGRSRRSRTSTTRARKGAGCSPSCSARSSWCSWPPVDR